MPSTPVNTKKERPLEPVFQELASKGFPTQGAFGILIRDVATRSDKTTDNNGQILPQANIAGRTEQLGTTVQNITADGNLNSLGSVDDTSTDHLTDGVGAPLAGGKRGFVALDTNNRLAGSFRANAVNIAGTPTAATGMSNDGISTVITIAAQTQQFGDGPITYNSGSFDPGGFNTEQFIFTSDPTFSGGAVVYQGTPTIQNQTAGNGNVNFGAITTVSGSAKTGGGNTGGTGGKPGGRGFNQG